MAGFVRSKGRLLVLVAVLGAFAAASAAPASAAAPGFFVGVDDDAAKWGRAQAVGEIANDLGLKSLRMTLAWRPGDTKLTATQHTMLDRAIAGTWGLRIVISVYGKPADAPRTEEMRTAYCNYVADLLRGYPSVDDVVIWNDPNDGAFWLPQYNADGTSAAPRDYAALLARCYPLLHEVRPGVNVIALTATKSADDKAQPGAHTVATWYRRLGEAYKAGGSTGRLFDTVGHIPHPTLSSERPWVAHTDGTIGQGDYAALMKALGDGLTGTPQPLPGQEKVTIWYLAQGFQTVPDTPKAGFYTGAETDRGVIPAWSPNAANDNRLGPAPDQATQLADAVRVAYCQPNVGAYFNFQLADEIDLEGWQSGVYWADWTPKASYTAFKRVIAEIAAGSVNCASFGVGGVPPAAAPVPATTGTLKITDIRAEAVSAFSARITWKTSQPASVRLVYGLPASGPTIWANPRGSEATLRALSDNTSYRVWLTAFSEDGQRVQATIPFHTTVAPQSPQASVSPAGAGTLQLDGQPWFPMAVWNRCPYEFDGLLAVGINFFADNPCTGGLQAQLDGLAGRAYSAATAGKPGGHGPGLIGWYHVDEPDGLGIMPGQLPPPPSGVGGVSFLTLTNHFYTGAAPLEMGRDIYPAYVAKAEVVGFDLYPLQEWCRPERVPDVYLAQQEIVKLAAGKPTFQWIEAASWKCPDGLREITPAVVEAESWLAIAGGAEGLGFWGYWDAAVGRRIGEIARTLPKIGEGLFATPMKASSDNGYVKVGARVLNGAFYVFAVNAGFEPQTATMRVSGLGSRALSALGENRSELSLGDVFKDSFPPLGVHIYVGAPLGDKD
jgi:hypothetical protein